MGSNVKTITHFCGAELFSFGTYVTLRLSKIIKKHCTVIVSQTSLSQYIHELKSKGIQPTVTWKLIDRGKPFSPVHGVCNLCLKEKYYITYKPEMAEINHRSEIFNHCVHKKSALMIKKKEKTKGPQGVRII